MKKIIGYKLIKPEYEEAAVKIVQKKAYNKTAKTFKKLDNINDNRIDFAAASLCHELLDKAKVLELWFKPVYEQDCNNDALEIIEFVLAQNSSVEIAKKEYKNSELVGIYIKV